MKAGLNGACALLLAALYVAALPLPARAAITDVDVVVDMAGADEVDAKAKAMDYAKKRAVFLALYRLNPEKAKAIAETLSAEQITQAIRGHEVVSELANDTRYRGKLTFSFNETQLRRLAGESVSDEAAALSPMLVIAVMHDGQQVRLWEPENTWRNIWNSVALERGQGSLIVPYGDPKDSVVVDSLNVLQQNYSSLLPLGERYGAPDIVLAYARYDTAQSPPALLVSLRHLSSYVDTVKDFSYEATRSDDTPEVMMTRAARDIADQLRQSAQEMGVEREREVAGARTVKLFAQFQRMGDWVKMQQMIKATPNVYRLTASAISIQGAEVEVYYGGTEEELYSRLATTGLRVVPQGERVMLSLN